MDVVRDEVNALLLSSSTSVSDPFSCSSNGAEGYTKLLRAALLGPRSGSGQTGELMEIRTFFVLLRGKHRDKDDLTYKLKLWFLKCFPAIHLAPGRKGLM